MQNSSPNNSSKFDRNIVLFLIAVVFLVTAVFYYFYKSKAEITVSENLPVTFYTKGSNSISFIEVRNSKGTLWRLYPQKGRYVTLEEISTIKYGEVPPSCVQGFPEDLSPPQQLVEGESYYAFAPLYGGGPINVSFTIKDGKVIGH